MDYKNKIKSELTIDDVYSILEDFGGEPMRQGDRIISTTICHNLPQEGSRKLYYYENGEIGIFRCYTGCAEPSFDIFELIIKVMRLQHNEEWSLPQAVDYVARRINFSMWGMDFSKEKEEDRILSQRLSPHTIEDYSTINLPTFDKKIIQNFSQPRILSWEQEGIGQEAMRLRHISYYPVDEQIIIPHYDINNNLVGIRGRCTNDEMAKRFGKYRPVKINGTLYNHPLGRNLYNINLAKENIKESRTAILFEAEKATMQYGTMFGEDNNISCAVCGSAFTSYQMYLLQKLGVNEIIFAFDRQFQSIGDEEFLRLKNKILKIHKRFGNYCRLSFIFDKEMITNYKASPTDEGKDKFIYLYKNRITSLD